MMLRMEDHQGAPDLRRFYLGHAQVNRAAGSTRRCLFGPADPAETRRFVQEEMRTIYERQKKKWNFDFEREQPVPGGRYLWERVGCSLPEQSRTEAGFGEDEASEHSERVPEPAEPTAAPAPAARPAEQRPSDRSSGRHARQPAISDSFRTRKRQRVSESSAKATEDGAPAPKRAPSPGQDAEAPSL